jgi:hypothetical protein
MERMEEKMGGVRNRVMGRHYRHLGPVQKLGRSMAVFAGA